MTYILKNIKKKTSTSKMTVLGGHVAHWIVLESIIKEKSLAAKQGLENVGLIEHRFTYI